MGKQFAAAVVAAFAVAVVPTAVTAAPAASKPGVAKQLKPKKRPTFRAVLVQGSEKATLRYSVDTFSTKGTAAPKGDRIVAWTATFGDSTKRISGTGVPKTISHRYYHRGQYTVTFTVTDARGKRTTGRLDRSVMGAYVIPGLSAVARTAALGGYLEAGVPVFLTLNVVTWNHLPATVAVDFGDRSHTTAAVHGSRVVLTHVFPEAGLYSVQISLHDSHNGSRFSQPLLRVLPPPSTRIVVKGGGYAQVGVPALVTLTEVAAAHEEAQGPPSFDADGGTVVPAPAGSGGTYLVTWSTPGVKTLRATVVGAATNMAFTNSTTVDLPVPPPLAVNLVGGRGSTGLDAQGDPTGDVGFGAAAVLNGHAVLTWDLDPGDGGGDLTGTGGFPPSVPVYYPVAGVYTATLTLRLDDGTAITGTASAAVADPPILSVTPSPASLSGGNMLSLSVSVTFQDGAGPVQTYLRWGDGDGSFQQLSGVPPAVVSHTYATGGSYVVTVEVRDSYGGYATQVIPVGP